MTGNREKRANNEEFENYASGIMNQVYRLIWPGCAIDMSSNFLRDKTLTINSSRYFIEEKHRRQVREDMLIEFVQDIITLAPGWFHYNKAKDTVIIYCMFDGDFGELKASYWVELFSLRTFLGNPRNWKYLRFPPPSTKGMGVTVNGAVKWDVLCANRIAHGLIFNTLLVQYPTKGSAIECI